MGSALPSFGWASRHVGNGTQEKDRVLKNSIFSTPLHMQSFDWPQCNGKSGPWRGTDDSLCVVLVSVQKEDCLSLFV